MKKIVYEFLIVFLVIFETTKTNTLEEILESFQTNNITQYYTYDKPEIFTASEYINQNNSYFDYLSLIKDGFKKREILQLNNLPLNLNRENYKKVLEYNISLWKDITSKGNSIIIVYKNNKNSEIRCDFSFNDFYLNKYNDYNSNLLCVKNIFVDKNNIFLESFIEFLIDNRPQNILTNMQYTINEYFDFIIKAWKKILANKNYQQNFKDENNWPARHVPDLFGGLYGKYFIIVPLLYMFYFKPIQNKKEYTFSFDSFNNFNEEFIEEQYKEIMLEQERIFKREQDKVEKENLEKQKNEKLNQLKNILLSDRTIGSYIQLFEGCDFKQELDTLTREADLFVAHGGSLDQINEISKEFYNMNKFFSEEKTQEILKIRKALKNNEILSDSDIDQALTMTNDLSERAKQFNDSNYRNHNLKKDLEYIQLKNAQYNHKQKPFLKRVLTDHNNKLLKKRLFTVLVSAVVLTGFLRSKMKR